MIRGSDDVPVMRDPGVMGPRHLGNVDRAAAYERAAAGAGAEFRQGHPNRHVITLSLPCGTSTASG